MIHKREYTLYQTSTIINDGMLKHMEGMGAAFIKLSILLINAAMKSLRQVVGKVILNLMQSTNPNSLFFFYLGKFLVYKKRWMGVPICS